MEKMSAKGGKTQENENGCCRGFCGKHKRKVVIVVLAVLLALAVLAIAKKVHSNRNFAGAGCALGQEFWGGKMLGRCGIAPPIDDQFYPPADAAKKGELAVVAADAGHVLQSATDIAEKNSGSITSTKVSYANNGAKKGFVVIQIPADKFESAFDALRSMGARVVSESTEVIERNDIYYPMAAGEASATQTADQQAKNSEGNASAQNDSISSMPAVYPLPGQYVQNKGYIRILFSDSGKSGWIGNRSAGGTIAINSNDFVVIFGRNLLKGSFLILLVAMLLWFIKMLKEQKAKTAIKKTTIPAVKKAAVKKVAIKRSRVIRKR